MNGVQTVLDVQHQGLQIVLQTNDVMASVPNLQHIDVGARKSGIIDKRILHANTVLFMRNMSICVP